MKTPPQKPTTPQEVPKSEPRDSTTPRAATAGDRVTGQSGLSVGKIKWWLGNTELEGVTDVTDSLRRGEDLTSAPRVDDGALLAEWKEALADVIFSRYTVTSETTGWLPALEMPQSATPTTFIRVRIHMKEGLGKGRIVDGVRQIDFYDASKIFEITGGSKSYFDGENLDFYIDPSITPHPVVERAKLGESKKPGYTGGTMGDAREYFALAAKVVEKAYDKGLSVAELDEAIEDKLAAKMGATARETTGRVTGEPRPAQQRTAQELFGVSASTPARRYHKSDGPEFCEAELADRVLLAAAEATRNEMKTRAKTKVLTTEERARWQRAGRFVYHARK
jgi:hypothetical protein